GGRDGVPPAPPAETWRVEGREPAGACSQSGSPRPAGAGATSITRAPAIIPTPASTRERSGDLDPGIYFRGATRPTRRGGPSCRGGIRSAATPVRVVSGRGSRYRPVRRGSYPATRTGRGGAADSRAVRTAPAIRTSGAGEALFRAAIRPEARAP